MLVTVNICAGYIMTSICHFGIIVETKFLKIILMAVFRNKISQKLSLMAVFKAPKRCLGFFIIVNSSQLLIGIYY